MSSDPFAATDDPFAAGFDGDDPFDSASSTFVGAEDLDDRLLLIMPTRIEKKKGKNGDPYDAVFCNLVVLDGTVTDKVPAVPGVLADVMWSASMMVAQLRPNLTSGRPKLGRLNSRPSTFNRSVRAYALAEPTEHDKVLGRAGWARFSKDLKPADPFA